jgi:hypothetical protein
MYKSLAGLAAAAVLTTVAASSPANAFAVRHAPGVAQDQATVEHVWHRGYPHRRYYRAYPRAYYYGGGPYYYGGPYAYGAPYPYYRRYYAPRPFVGIGVGPFGFGVW